MCRSRTKIFQLFNQELIQKRHGVFYMRFYWHPVGSSGILDLSQSTVGSNANISSSWVGRPNSLVQSSTCGSSRRELNDCSLERSENSAVVERKRRSVIVDNPSFKLVLWFVRLAVTQQLTKRFKLSNIAVSRLSSFFVNYQRLSGCRGYA